MTRSDIYFGDLAQHHYAAHPLTLIDVGARGGLQPNWKAASRHLKLVGFEPDRDEYARLCAAADPKRAVYINAALWREPASLSLNVARDPGTSSVLEPNLPFLRRFPRAERFEVAHQFPVTADSLDRLLAAHGIEDPDFLKIDTQGSEFAVIEGARTTLASAILGAEIEVQLAPLYRGQATFGAIDEAMRTAGLQLFDLRPAYWKRAAGADYGGPKGQLVFGDALYLRTEESLNTELERTADAGQRTSKLLRALSVSLLYGYVDYAIELLGTSRALIDPALASGLERKLRTGIPLSARLPHFRGRGWLSHALYRMHRALFPTLDRWASGGRHLGNVD